jgi:hypothetical protein
MNPFVNAPASLPKSTGSRQWIPCFGMDSHMSVPFLLFYSALFFFYTGFHRKYYDDCAQILSEHILAAVKPKSLRGFSTLDPLITTSNNLSDEAGEEAPNKFPILNRVARMLQGEPHTMSDTRSEESTPVALSPSRSEHSTSGFNTNAAATTLEEGAIPVRDLPHNLMSEPASLVASTNSSTEDLTKLDIKKKNEMKRVSSMISTTEEDGVHTEELRCVIAVVRHGDRTPKQKLKVNMIEPLILKYFTDHTDHPAKDLKVKAKGPMTEFLVTVKQILAEKDKEKEEAAANGVVIKQNTKVINQLKHMRDILVSFSGNIISDIELKRTLISTSTFSRSVSP